MLKIFQCSISSHCNKSLFVVYLPLNVFLPSLSFNCSPKDSQWQQELNAQNVYPCLSFFPHVHKVYPLYNNNVLICKNTEKFYVSENFLIKADRDALLPFLPLHYFHLSSFSALFAFVANFWTNISIFELINHKFRAFHTLYEYQYVNGQIN